jgi:hypothetical protein
MSDRMTLSGLFALLVVGAALAVASPARAQDWATMKSARQLQDQKPMRVEIEYGAGSLRVLPAAKSMLYEMELRYDKRYFEPVTDFNSAGRTLHLGMKSRDRDGKNISMKEGSRATIKLTPEAPLDLELQFGAGEADIDLGGVRLRKLDLSTGASRTRVRFGTPNPIAAQDVEIKAGAAELTVIGLGNLRAQHLEFQGGVGSATLDFSGAWNLNSTASVQMGVGSVTLRLPKGLGVRINKSSFMSSFDAPGMVKRDGSYYSSNWSSAAHQLTIDVDAAFGSIDIEWIG